MKKYLISLKSGKALCISADVVEESKSHVKFYAGNEIILSVASDCVEYMEVMINGKPIAEIIGDK